MREDVEIDEGPRDIGDSTTEDEIIFEENETDFVSLDSDESNESDNCEDFLDEDCQAVNKTEENYQDEELRTYEYGNADGEFKEEEDLFDSSECEFPVPAHQTKQFRPHRQLKPRPNSDDSSSAFPEICDVLFTDRSSSYSEDGGTIQVSNSSEESDF